MTNRRPGPWLTGTLAVVVLVVTVAGSGVVARDVALVIGDGAQLGAGLAATLSCGWMARRTTGLERTWRRRMARGMGAWTVGMGLWAWYQIVSGTPLPCPSLADVGFLMMPVFAVAALLAFAVQPSRYATEGTSHGGVVFLLDGLVVVGSLFVLTWATSLGTVVRSAAPSPEALAVAVAYPTADLVLVVMVVLLAVTRQVPEQFRAQLWLLGSGLVAIALSDSAFAYLIGAGADAQPPVASAGFVAGPLLVAVAGITTAARPRTRPAVRPHPAVERAHLLLPYGLVVITGTVIAGRAATGARVDAVGASLAWAVIIIMLLRQMITLLQNTALLERVSAAQAALAHRAHHDPLTGLANRELLGDRLGQAVARYRQGRQFALLFIDLDDLKLINDSLGHSAGDRVLHAAGQRLRASVRATDTVARIGGDEFAVVLDGTGDTPDVVSVRILDALRRPFQIGAARVAISATIGVARPRLGDRCLTPEQVLRRADSAMYMGKRWGKDLVVFDQLGGPYQAPFLPAAHAPRPAAAPAPRPPLTPERRPPVAPAPRPPLAPERRPPVAPAPRPPVAPIGR